ALRQGRARHRRRNQTCDARCHASLHFSSRRFRGSCNRRSTLQRRAFEDLGVFLNRPRPRFWPIMAPTNKCLAETNKSGTTVKRQTGHPAIAVALQPRAPTVRTSEKELEDHETFCRPHD